MIFYLLWERANVACISQGSIKKKINTINIIWKPRNNNIFLRKENSSNNNKQKKKACLIFTYTVWLVSSSIFAGKMIDSERQKVSSRFRPINDI